MCGQVGVIGTIDNKGRDAFWNLLIFSQVRGMHSTGVAGFERHKPDPIILKDIGVPTDLCQYKKWDELFSTNWSRTCYIGHNRSKTIGDATKANAHPFEHGKIVGAHNGTLLHRSKVALEGPMKSFGTDSESIFFNLDKNGVEDTINKLDGAWSLVWINKTENKLYITRNNQRDLYYCYADDRKMMFWASEHWFLRAALLRNGFKIDDDIYVVKPDHLYEFKIPGFNDKIAAPKITSYEELLKDFKAPVVEEKSAASSAGVFQRAAKAVVENLTGGSHKHGSTCNSQNLVSAMTGRIEYPELYKSDFVVADKTCSGQGYTYVGKANTRMYKGYDRSLIAKKYWEKIADNGCAWCNSQSQWGDYIEFISRDEFICAECLLNDEVKRYLIN